MQLLNLEYLELGDNRIKKIENLDNNKNIERLFLSANQIRRIECLDALSEKLKVLNLSANAIIKIEVRIYFFYLFSSSHNLQGLEKLHSLEQLYIMQNGIQKIEGLDTLEKLEFLDLNQNRIERIENVAHLTCLTDFYAK